MSEKTWQPRWLTFLRKHAREQSVALLLRYLIVLVVVVAVFSVAFHVLMVREGQHHEWWAGPYWTVSTMTTLGLGDIIFESAAGEALTTVVVLSGILFMLVFLPLVLIQFPPWIEARSAARVRRALPNARGHVLITRYDPVAAELIPMLKQYRRAYSVIAPTVNEAMQLEDQGIDVMLGEVDHPDTWRNAGLERAALMVATDTDTRNPNAVFTGRGVAPDVPILATAKRPEVADVLDLAGCSHVLQLSEMMGRSLARRVIGGDALSHEIGRFGDLLIAEASAARTPLVGRRLVDSKLDELVDVSVVGVWDRGEFQLAGPDTTFGELTTLVLAGTREQLSEYDQVFAIYNVSDEPVVVIGGGAVGTATARSLEARGIPYRILDKRAVVLREEHGIQGDAADIEVLERAGIAKAPAVVITTHDDDTNVFLALYCRRLRPDLQIISRANFEKNVETLHRAGTDSVVSLTSMGANAIFNVLERDEVLTVSEGLNLFRCAVPDEFAGRSLADIELRQTTGCGVVALWEGEAIHVPPDPNEPLPSGADLLLVGSREAESTFLETYGG
jgi:Trk K+ transport system NAD-binding subunit